MSISARRNYVSRMRYLFVIGRDIWDDSWYVIGIGRDVTFTFFDVLFNIRTQQDFLALWAIQLLLNIIILALFFFSHILYILMNYIISSALIIKFISIINPIHAI